MPKDIADPTTNLPLETLVAIFEAGRFSQAELASLRLVNRAFRDAASFASFYRRHTVKWNKEDPQQIADYFAYKLPAYVTDSLHHLVIRGRCGVAPEAALAGISLPNLVTLELLTSSTVVDASAIPGSVTELNLACSPDLDFDLLVQRMPNLECLGLEIEDVAQAMPITSLTRLRRLSLVLVGWSETGEGLTKLLTALAASPLAATLEALEVYGEGVSAEAAWMESISALSALRELGINVDEDTPRGEAGGFAHFLQSLDQLEVLTLDLCLGDVVDAIHVCGLPANLRVLNLFGAYRAVHSTSAMVAVLPHRTLRAVRFRGAYGEPNASKLADLVAACPGVQWWDISVGSDVPGAIEDGTLTFERPVVFKQKSPQMNEAMVVAGHTVADFEIDIDWRQAGAVFKDGVAVALE